jgi:hypothetical protein
VVTIPNWELLVAAPIAAAEGNVALIVITYAIMMLSQLLHMVCLYLWCDSVLVSVCTDDTFDVFPSGVVLQDSWHRWCGGDRNHERPTRCQRVFRISSLVLFVSGVAVLDPVQVKWEWGSLLPSFVISCLTLCFLHRVVAAVVVVSGVFTYSHGTAQKEAAAMGGKHSPRLNLPLVTNGSCEDVAIDVNPSCSR